MSDAPVLSVDEVSISFTDRDDREGVHRRTVVDRVSFDLTAGRVLALVGESGSGKSVTAMSTLGLLPSGATVTGSVRLLGEELLGAGPERLRQVRGGSVGTVFQEPMTAFNPVITIGRQISEALAAHGLDGGRTKVGDRVGSLLASVGIADPARVARSYPHELSGGQLQRAMIAMAISCDPVALIADEPTTALDVTVQAGILDLIRELRDRLGTAVLLITHDMGVVADLADDVVVMRDGRVVERADASELFAHPTAEYTQRLLAAVPRLDELRLADPAVATDRARRRGTDVAGAGDALDASDAAARVRRVRRSRMRRPASTALRSSTAAAAGERARLPPSTMSRSRSHRDRSSAWSGNPAQANRPSAARSPGWCRSAPGRRPSTGSSSPTRHGGRCGWRGAASATSSRTRPRA